MSEHTPGPWKAENLDLTDPWNDTAWVAGPRGSVHMLHPADARLIAAAPDLLAALEASNAALNTVAQGPDAGFASMARAVMDIADAAIAKAKGES